MITGIYNFLKEDSGKWYIDIPGWERDKAELEMVEGADTMLDYVSENDSIVTLKLSDTSFTEANELELRHDYSQQTGGGGIYFLERYEGETMNQEMWLCEVTEYVFGRLPQIIYFKKV